MSGVDVRSDAFVTQRRHIPQFYQVLSSITTNDVGAARTLLSNVPKTSVRCMGAAGDSPKTISRSISVTGIGLHSGRPITLRMTPAAVGTGIVFLRNDLDRSLPIEALRPRGRHPDVHMPWA